MIPKLQIDSGTLYSVPAVHYRAFFAEAVNALCANARTRPKAIAVELGAEACTAIVKWMKELGVSPNTRRDDRKRLPCMLGLIRNNRLIHPDFKDKAINLQKQFGGEIDAVILRSQLHYSPLSLICLSATDSIIEAIRSAIEWNIPVYGIDIEEFANHDRTPILIEDPNLAADNLVRYIEQNCRRTVVCRDEKTDSRRETVMASRLGYLVKEFQNVLFTCGLAHWDKLVKLLSDPGLVVAPPAFARGSNLYERVVVDPVTAIHHMDAFPQITTRFESLRAGGENRMSQTERRDYFIRIIRDAYMKVAQDSHDVAATGCIESYFQYLANLCVLYQRGTSDIFMVLTAADAIVSRDFSLLLASEMIHGSISWATSEDYPDLPYLRAVSFNGNELVLSKNSQKVEIVRTDGSEGPFFVSGADMILPSPSEMLNLRSKKPPPPPPPPPPGKGPSSGIWPPCEYLLYGTAYQTAELVTKTMKNGKSEPFCGSIEGGVDYKATARAAIWAAVRNDMRPCIQVRALGKAMAPEEALCDPFVYIFEADRFATGSRPDWSLTRAWSAFPDHLDDRYRPLVNETSQRFGDIFTAAVYFSEERSPERELLDSKLVAGLHLLWGALIFGNPCVDALQSAKWIESWIGEGENKHRCPILQSGSFECLVNMFARRHNIELDVSDWKETLIRIAIPYARQRVIVTASDNSCITSRVRIEAKRHKVKLVFIPLSDFSAERIDNIRKQYYAYPMDKNAAKWSHSLEELLGQKSDSYSDLVPARIRMQTDRNA